MEEKRKFMQLLEKASAFHGHLCAGQIVGVRIAMLGLRELGITDPLGADRKKIIVFVEVSRCAADAIMTVTGCRVGKRSFKIVDYGKVAATFMNMVTDQAIRVVLLPDVMETIAERYPGLDEGAAEKKAYMEMTDKDLFRLQDVSVVLKDEDTPGTPTDKVRCVLCGETIIDKRDIQQGNRILCRPCAIRKSYYIVQSSVRRVPIKKGIFG